MVWSRDGASRKEVRMREIAVNGYKQGGVSEPYVRANENVARAVAYLGPYLFWGVVTTIVGGILLLQ